MRQILAVLVALLATLGATELTLRYLDRPEQIVAGWWRESPEDRNQLLARGRPIEYDDNDFVILILGDSQAQGFNLSFDKMPSLLLERELHRLGYMSVRVFSLAVVGHGQDQQLLMLEKYFEDHEFRADLVLMWESPSNDIWNNLFPNAWEQGSQPKPTFALVEGKLIGPSMEMGQPIEPILSSVKLFALLQTVFAAGPTLATSDAAWSERYLPPPYAPVEPRPELEPVMLWQSLYNRGWGFMSLEQFGTDKSNYAIGFVPVSPRIRYAIELMNALLHRTKELVESRGGTFLAFRSKTRTSRLFGQEMHLEPRPYVIHDKLFRFSFKQEWDNIDEINEGIEYYDVDCEIDDWRLTPEDWHLNEAAVGDVVKKLASLLAEKEKLPSRATRQSAPPG